LRERNGFEPETIEDVIYGCVTPVDEQGMNIGRLAPMVAGWGDIVPGVQLNRMCGSGQQAANFAAANVMAGQHDVLIAGGVEHMTRVPMGSDGDSLTDTYFEHFDELTTQGEGAERIAEEYDLTREGLDEIAADSQRRWKEAWDEGRYDDQITPVETELDGEESESQSDSDSRTGSETTRETVVVEQDEHPRPGTDVETLSELPLSFREEGEGFHHPGNSSGIVDGSCALLITSEEAAEEHGWDPMARIVQTEVVGVDPVTMLKGPIPATENVLEQAEMTVGDIDLFEGQRGVRVGCRRVARGDRRVLGGRQRQRRGDRPRPPAGRDRRDVADETRPRTRANGARYRAVDDVYRLRAGRRDDHRTGLSGRPRRDSRSSGLEAGPEFGSRSRASLHRLPIYTIGYL